jgi:enoyl-CoA hydratase/carnithine racemase
MEPSLGLVNHVYPETAFADEVKVFARRLAAAAPLAVAAVKRTIDISLGAGLDAVLEDERIAQRRLFATADFREGVAAFLTKRAAEFKGE